MRRPIPISRNFTPTSPASIREEIADLGRNGCTYLQIDETNFAYLCDPKLREQVRAHRRGSGEAAAHLCAAHQQRDRRQAREHDRVHASLPRQRQQRLGRGGRLRARGGDAVQRDQHRPAISSNTIPRAPAGSSRCASCPRARSSCSGWSRPRRASSKARTTLKRRIDEASEIRAARATGAQPAMRLLQQLRHQCAICRGADRQAPPRCRGVARDLGLRPPIHPPHPAFASADPPPAVPALWIRNIPTGVCPRGPALL